MLRLRLSTFFTLAAIFAPPLSSAEPKPNAPTELSPGAVFLPGHLDENRSPAGNSVVLRGADGLVVVDTGRDDDHTAALLALVDEMGAEPLAVVNTHWHLDHIGGNARVRQSWPQARLFAHPALDAALAGFHAESRERLRALLPTLDDRPELSARLEAELRLLELGRALAADEPLTTEGTVVLAGRELDLHVETTAVSGGDLWLVDRATGVLIAGDLVTLPVPLLDTACPEGWSEALSRMSDATFSTLAPGHGPPLDPTRFALYRGAFDRLLDCASSDRTDEDCTERWVADAEAMIGPFDQAYPRKLLAYYLKASLRPEAPLRKRWCATLTAR